MRGEKVEYSIAFQRQVVEEIAQGKHSSMEAARRRYCIPGSVTIRGWIKRHGREDLLPKRIRVETMKERDELKEARRRIKELEAQVADVHMDYALERSFLEIACERMGESPEEFKKKHPMTRLAALAHDRKG
jgi:transposase-like protein